LAGPTVKKLPSYFRQKNKLTGEIS